MFPEGLLCTQARAPTHAPVLPGHRAEAAGERAELTSEPRLVQSRTGLGKQTLVLAVCSQE